MSRQGKRECLGQRQKELTRRELRKSESHAKTKKMKNKRRERIAWNLASATTRNGTKLATPGDTDRIFQANYVTKKKKRMKGEEK
jgi:hypothetical protein